MTRIMLWSLPGRPGWTVVFYSRKMSACASDAMSEDGSNGASDWCSNPVLVAIRRQMTALPRSFCMLAEAEDLMVEIELSEQLRQRQTELGQNLAAVEGVIDPDHLHLLVGCMDRDVAL